MEYSEIISQNITLFFSGLLAAMILALALEEKLHAKKSIIVGTFAIVCLLIASGLGIIPFGDIILPGGHKLHMPVYIEAVDWEVIAIIIGSSLFVDVISRSGLFSWVAIKLTKMSNGDPLKLLWSYGGLTVLFSAVLNNVTAMIILGSLTAVSLNKLNQSDKLLGFLLIEALLTNIGGLTTLISSVPNIIVGQAAGISFVQFFVTASPYVLVATVATILMGSRIFSITALTGEQAIAESAELIDTFDENDGIESDTFFWFATTMLVLFVVAIATTSVVPVLRDTDSMGLADIEKGIIDYGTKAKQGKLGIEEMTGGTFTITNGGIFGSLISTPILNPPQTAILGMHNIVERPMAVNGEVVIRPIMYLALSYDHRIIDGKESVSFLKKVKDMLEHPESMLFGSKDPIEVLLGM